MNHPKKLILAASAASLVAMVTLSSAQAQQMIGLNFEGDNASILAPTDLAGVVPQANFNNEPGQTGTVATGLLDSTGAATTIGVNWTGQGTWDANKEGNLDQFVDVPGTNNHTLMSGYLDLYNNNAPAVQFTGLTPGSLYDVYVYSLTAVAGRGGTFDVNGSPAQLVTNATSTTFQNNVNYLLFPAVTVDGSGDININNDSSLTVPTIYREAINGVQLVAAGVVPEPVSLGAVAAAAALGLGFRRRRG